MLSGQLWMVTCEGPAVGWVKIRPGRSVTLNDEARMSSPSKSCKRVGDFGEQKDSIMETVSLTAGMLMEGSG